MNGRRATVLVLLMTAAGACTRWERTPGVPAPREEPVALRTARVSAGTTPVRVVLRDVRVTADSVTGWYRPADPSGLLSGPLTRFAVHRDQVLAFEQPVPDALATAGGALIAVVVGYVAVGLWYLATGEV